MSAKGQFLTGKQERGVSYAAYLLVTVAFLGFVGFLVASYPFLISILQEQLKVTPAFVWLAAGYGAFAVALVVIIRRFNSRGWRSPWVWGAAIFCIALCARLIAYQYIVYIPTSDFSHYYHMGAAFARGDYAFISDLTAKYQIPSFSGLAVINGLTMSIFGTSVRAFQLAQCFITALIAVLAFLIARRFDEASAPLAGLLFALYPANIVLSQVTNNQHFAILFALLAIWLALLAFHQKKLVKAAALALGSGAALLLSYYAHPSTVTTLVAFGVFWLVLALTARKQKRELLRLAIVLVSFCLGFFALRAGADAGLRAAGLSGASTGKTCYLSKVVVGLNPDTVGGFSAEDYGAIAALPVEEQNAYCLARIGERLKRDDLGTLINSKLLRMWMLPDESFYWATDGACPVSLAPPSEQDIAVSKWLVGAQLLDFYYVAVLYAFAWIGGLVRKRSNAGELALWVLLGWMGAHVLLEVQTRYRYLAMPLLMMFAAYSCFRLIDGVVKRLQARRQKADAGASVEAPEQISDKS